MKNLPWQFGCRVQRQQRYKLEERGRSEDTHMTQLDRKKLVIVTLIKST